MMPDILDHVIDSHPIEQPKDRPFSADEVHGGAQVQLMFKSGANVTGLLLREVVPQDNGDGLQKVPYTFYKMVIPLTNPKTQALVGIADMYLDPDAVAGIIIPQKVEQTRVVVPEATTGGGRIILPK